jgi:hypothetical protein
MAGTTWFQFSNDLEDEEALVEVISLSVPGSLDQDDAREIV